MYNRVFVAIAATDISQTIDFYGKLLQLEPEKYIPNVYAEFTFQQFAIAIFQPSPNNLDEFNNSQGSSMSLCLEVPDLEAAIAFIKLVADLIPILSREATFSICKL